MGLFSKTPPEANVSKENLKEKFRGIILDILEKVNNLDDLNELETAKQEFKTKILEMLDDNTKKGRLHQESFAEDWFLDLLWDSELKNFKLEDKERREWGEKLIKDIKEAKDLKDFIERLFTSQQNKFNKSSEVFTHFEEFKKYINDNKNKGSEISEHLIKEFKIIFPVLNETKIKDILNMHLFYFNSNNQINNYIEIQDNLEQLYKTLKSYNIKDGEALASKLEKYQLHDKFFESNYIRDMFIYFDEKKADYYLTPDEKTLNPKASIVAMKLVSLFRDYYYYTRFDDKSGLGNIQYKICEDKPVEEIPADYKKDITTRTELVNLHLPTVEIFFSILYLNKLGKIGILIRGNNLNPLLKKEIT